MGRLCAKVQTSITQQAHVRTSTRSQELFQVGSLLMVPLLQKEMKQYGPCKALNLWDMENHGLFFNA